MSEIKPGQLRLSASGELFVVLERVSDEHWSIMFHNGKFLSNKWFYPWIEQAELVSEPEVET